METFCKRTVHRTGHHNILPRFPTKFCHSFRVQMDAYIHTYSQPKRRFLLHPTFLYRSISISSNKTIRKINCLQPTYQPIVLYMPLAPKKRCPNTNYLHYMVHTTYRPKRRRVVYLLRLSFKAKPDLKKSATLS